MTAETQEKFFKLYMQQGLKDKAYAIFKGSPPESLLEENKMPEEEETQEETEEEEAQEE